MPMFESLKNKNVIVSGAAQGIGKETAQVFLSKGSNVGLIDIQQDKLIEVQKELKALFPQSKVEIAQADLSQKSQVEKAVAHFTQTLGDVHILINNAGILRDASLLKMEEAQFDQVIDVHLKGTFLLTQLCAKIFSTQNYGKIVNLSSVASRGNFGQTNYSAAKAGIIGMTKTWALELSKYKVNVNAIAPGLIETDMTRSIPQPVLDTLVSRIPMKRMGNVTEIANLICFLASDDSSYIQGEVIHINGGFLM
jgi:3-oxoacyl-[acyl-carrier protein] reductase